jgi:hypothetical protein
MMTKKTLDMAQIDELLVRTAQLRGEVSIDRDMLSAIQAALTERRTMPHELALTIASTIAYSAGVALAAHGVPKAAQLSAEVGNNCAHTVVLILEAFLDDGTIIGVPRKEG